MLRSRWLLIFALLIALMLMAFRQTVLVDPPAIAVTGKLSAAQVLKAVKMALVHRGWTITAAKAGEVDSTLNVRDHTVRIAVDYSATQVSIKYVDSTNLKYEVKNGTRYIHKNYLGWIQNLSNDIQTNLIQLGG